MSNLINTYPVFESSQVLTSSQLNQVVSYLDQQSRLTRAKLIGMGIVCGLKLSYDDSDPDTQVIISKGTAITSEGFLVSLGDCATSWYRPYSLPEGVQYRPFGNPDQDVELYELLREMPEDDTDVLPLDNPGDFLDDKFVLLFLETFDNDLKSCLGNACDELGIDRIFTVRKLLISKEDLDLVLTRSANVGNLYPDKFELPDIVMPRTLFDPDNAHSQDFTAFSEHYIDTFINSAYPALFGDESTPGALADTYSVYELLLGPLYGFNNPFESSAIDDLNNIFDDFTGSDPDFRGIQYFYDFLKDMILAYDEFRETAFDLLSECCPDMSRFPKHIMLGRAVVPNETHEEKSEYRHGFIQPPIYNHQKYLIDKAVSLHKRLVLMAAIFDPERFRYSDSDEEDVPPLRITPSDEKTRPLSRRSIPYYYDIKQEVPLVGDESLEQHWNFDFTRKKDPGTTSLILGYDNQSDDQSSIINPLETPLYYDLDRFPFLRIEGHLGRPFEDAVDIINAMKSSFDLPFDLVSLQLDPEGSLIELDYSCGFEDLQEEYTIARNTYCGFINDLANLFIYIRENQDTIFNGDDDTLRDLEMIEEILESLLHLCELMTDCLDEFEFEAFQESYKVALQLILDFLLVEKRLLEEINIAEDSDEEVQVINGLIQRISPAAFRIIDLLFYNTFLRVYYAFKRREHYLQQETGIFSSYIRHHPGVNHQAGVYKGGTFILVYNNSVDREVVADFTLPYLCCSTERCVPMCDEDDSTFVFNVPPFARPDYAVTTIGRPVEIDVSLNDFGFWTGGFSVETENETENGGIIEQLTEEGRLRYVPNEEFTGFDKFQYRIINSVTGTQDTGTVTILVKGREVSGCYSSDILRCWAAGDINMLVEIYNRRHPNSPIPGDSEDEVVEALLQSLRETRGFTLDEIRFSALESEERRRRLLTCIGIPHDDGTSYQELERLIVDYQNEHCGEVTEEPAGCYSREILGCWGIQSVQFALRIREIDASDMSADQMIDALLESLRETGGFTQNEIRTNVLESEQSRRQLLTCLGINHTPNTTYPELEQLILAYQIEHCGGGIVSTPRIELNVNEITGNDLRTVLSSRGREVSGDMTVSDLETEIRGTTEGMSFTPDEVMLFTRDRITQLLRNRNLSAPSRANKSELIEILFSQS